MGRILLLSSTVLLVCSVSFGQSDRGTITGTISDPTSAVIPGATVVAANTETGVRYETVSTETGNYTLGQLPVGVYQLSVELPGFKKYVRQGINALLLKHCASMCAWTSVRQPTKLRSVPMLHC